MRTHIIYICGSAKLLIGCLLGLLSFVAAGQTSAPYVARKPGVELTQWLMQGGMIRQYTDDLFDQHRGWYMILPSGVTSLMSMNFVDGYSVGPESTFGIVMKDRSRWEVEEMVRWAFSRKTLVARGALRYYWPVENETMIELHGGQSMVDFDAHPTTPMAQLLMASGLCGWNHYKLYESTTAGVRFTTPLMFDLKMSADIAWERRRKQQNHSHRNLFGAHAQDNTPRVGVPNTAHDLMLYEGPIDAELVKASLRFDYKHMRSLLVKDDMTTVETLPYPTLSLLLDMGVGKNRQADRFGFMTVDLRVDHTEKLPRLTDLLSYSASAGFMVKHGTIGLADRHHFDASRLWWQRTQESSRFTLLDNYELSTDKCWTEGHAEWSSTSMLLTRLVNPHEEWREYLQLHAVKVPDHRLHWESQYGWDFFRFLRVGVSVGFDDMTYRGTAVTMTLDLNAINAAKYK